MADLLPPAKLLAHTPPMILIDEVVEYAPPRIVCRVGLRPDSLFVEDGKVPALLCVEYMAQAIGCFAGFVRLARGQTVRIGFLLGAREIKLEADHLAVGDEVLVEAERLFGESTFGTFRCAVSVKGRQVASGVVNIFQSPDEEEVPNP
jgi:predicted hotdog family 3-hydroxylacyl-ACP dehydratase